MKVNDEVIYTISITGIKGLAAQNAIMQFLPHHIGSSKVQIAPATGKTPGTITIPRLFTRWREDYQETAWQNILMEAVKGHGASIAIDVQPWSHAAGYPTGDVDL